MSKIIYDLCGAKGNWSKDYMENGYDVRIITLPENDVRLLCPPDENVYGILAAPPCTRLAGSGARWWKEAGLSALFEALAIVDACIRMVAICQPKFWCLENPVGRLVHYLGKPKMYFNPCDYGDPYTKKTCLWGDFNIPKKNPIEPIEGSKIHLYPPSKNRSALRAITPPGFAKAFFESNR